MSRTSIGVSDDLHAYILRHGVREPAIFRRLREETSAIPESGMQIAPDQGAFLAMLVGIIQPKRSLELGTFTGYSSLAIATAMPADGVLVCCDLSDEWTSVARRYWAEAGVTERIDLRLGPALETLDALLAGGGAGTFDFAFIDASKREYPDYHERIVQLLRQGGLAVYDNVLWGGAVVDRTQADPDTAGIRRLNERIERDGRVEVSMIAVGDGLTLARKR